MNAAYREILTGEQQTGAFGGKLQKCCGGSALIYLYGDLGAGKTTLVRGFLRATGWQKAVKSPTYTLLEPYQTATGTIYHFDLYRLADPEELEYLGFRDYLEENTVCLIEWPERGAAWLPQADLTVKLDYHPQGRELHVRAHSSKGEHIMACLRAQPTTSAA